MLNKEVGEAEVIVIIQDVETIDNSLIGHVTLRVAHHLVEERERIAHTTIGLLSYDVQSRLLGCDTLLRGHLGEMLHDIAQLDASEVVDLTTRKDGGQHLMTLGSSQDEDGMTRGFLQSLEESIERRRREHVYLVDDEHLVATNLGRYAHLVDEFANVVNRVIRRSIELMDIVGALLIERTT